MPASDPVDSPIPCRLVPAQGNIIIITEGLPDGATIEIIPKYGSPTNRSVCQPDRCSSTPDYSRCEQAGGILGGPKYGDIESVQLHLRGTESLGHSVAPQSNITPYRSVPFLELITEKSMKGF